MSKMKKVNKRKGITLIEVIISVALIAILLIPLTDLVMTSIKKNKKAEVKQEATNLGQKIVEELKAQDTIQLHDFDSSTNIGKYTTLDGYVLNVIKESDEWKMEGPGDKDLPIEVTLKKNDKVKYNNNDKEVEKLKDDQYAVVIKFTDNYIKWETTSFDANGNAKFTSTNNLPISGLDVVKLTIENDGENNAITNVKIDVGSEDASVTGEPKVTYSKQAQINNIRKPSDIKEPYSKDLCHRIKIIRDANFNASTKLLAYIRGDVPKDLTDEQKNKASIDIDYIDLGDDLTKTPIDLRLDYSSDSSTEACKINLRQNISETQVDTLHSLYDINVSISDGTDVLYSSQISTNTDIEVFNTPTS
ncbi:type II secretion system GspH family protein [Clostridium sp. MSJ-8]|nr:type II secretion system GspH family protein [Clostridium sp. MSJ-8]